MKTARGRHPRGWLRTEKRSEGETWVLFYRKTRESDGKRVEHKLPVGLVCDFPSKAAAWRAVDRLHLGWQINRPDFRGRITFAHQHTTMSSANWVSKIVQPTGKPHTMIAGYNRVLGNRLIPRWGKRVALGIQPLEIEQCLKEVKHEEALENPKLGNKLS